MNNKNAEQAVRRVVLVDDHQMVRETLTAVLELDKSLEVVATAGDGTEGLRLIAQHKPDVAVLDIDMPGRTCFDVAESVPAVSEKTRIILLSGHRSDSYIQLALKVGVSGFVTKDVAAEEVVEAVRTVASGGRYFTGSIRERIAWQNERGSLFGDVQTPLESLSVREREVLTQLARGLSVKEVAAVLNLSRKTVDNHAQRLMAKLDIHTRSELVMFAFREKLVS